MMEANMRQRHKPASLSVQVMHAERAVLERRRLVSARATALGQILRTQMTSQSVLLWAGGLGFAAGEITRRRTSNSGAPGQPRGSPNTLFGLPMKLFSLVRTMSSVFGVAEQYVHHKDAFD